MTIKKDLPVSPDSLLQKKWSRPTVVRDEYAARKDSESDPGVSFLGDPGLTDQSQAKDCDVNVIVERFMKTGELPNMISQNPEYGDFSTPNDYQESLNLVIKAQEQFESLNARIRAQFNNDPAAFLEFATDPKNVDAMVDMGLASPRQPDPLLSEMQGIRADLKAGSSQEEGSPAPADNAKRNKK